MLYQATEHALLTILKITTGLGVNSNNLNKLAQYCSMISDKVPTIFPRIIENDKQIFQSLQRTYIETRYREGYSISMTEMFVLFEKVESLKQTLGVFIIIWAKEK